MKFVLKPVRGGKYCTTEQIVKIGMMMILMGKLHKLTIWEGNKKALEVDLIRVQ